MILPEPRRDRLHQKGKAFLSTILLAAVVYSIMLLGSFTLEKPTRQIFREIDLASFAPPALDPEVPSSSESEAETEGEQSESTEPAASEEVTSALAQLDLSALFPQDATLETETLDNSRQNRADETTESEISVETSGLSGLGDLDALNSLAGSTEPAARGRAGQRSDLGNAGISLAGGTGSTASLGANSQLGGGGSVVGGNVSRANNTGETDMTVERMSLDEFGSDYDRLEVQELIDWMKRNPGELPIGVRQLVRYRPAFLSSVTTFTIDGKPYELYLMCKERLYEIHIVLVDAEASTYLVDRSFQKLSTYLSEGQVRRAQRGEITAVRSQRNAASSDASHEFYSLFLSWWEQAKADS